MINLNECKKGDILIDNIGIRYKYIGYKDHHIITTIFCDVFINNDGTFPFGCEYIVSIYRKITVYALLDNLDETFDTKEELKNKYPNIDDFSIAKITYKKLLQQKE